MTLTGLIFVVFLLQQKMIRTLSDCHTCGGNFPWTSLWLHTKSNAVDLVTFIVFARKNIFSRRKIELFVICLKSNLMRSLPLRPLRFIVGSVIWLEHKILSIEQVLISPTGLKRDSVIRLYVSSASATPSANTMPSLSPISNKCFWFIFFLQTNNKKNNLIRC